MKKSIILTVFFFLVLTGAVGCTPQMQKSFDDFKLNDHVQSYTVMNESERLLEHLFDSKSFSREEEIIAHDALTNDKEGLATTWTNERFGEIALHPGEYLRHGNRKCRRFKAFWVIHAVGSTKMKESGSACLNMKTARWEWIVL